MFQVTKQELLNKLNTTDQMTVFIMRGLPGSGKSTLVKEIIDKGQIRNVCGVHISSADLFWGADLFWEGLEGPGYNFDPKLLKDAHEWCLRSFIVACTHARSSIFVDNTNLSQNEYEHYIKIAKAYGYEVVVITIEVDVNTSFTRNIHNVPKKTILSMGQRYDYAKLYLNRLPELYNTKNYLVNG